MSRAALGLVAVLLVLALGAGCLGTEDAGSESELELTVENAGSDPVTAEVTVRGPEGTALDGASDELPGGVHRTFEFTVAGNGRHEATVTGEEWRGQVAWNADSCARFTGTVTVGAGSVEVAGECVEPR